MKKQTRYVLIGIGIVSTVIGVYGVIQNKELMSSLSGIFIGLAIILIVIFEKSNRDDVR